MRVLGFVLMASPLVAFVIVSARELGWIELIKAFGLLMAILAVVLLGAILAAG